MIPGLNIVTPKRQSREPTDDWQQLQLPVRLPEQRAYDSLRPVVLFGGSIGERASQKITPQCSLYRVVPLRLRLGE